MRRATKVGVAVMAVLAACVAVRWALPRSVRESATISLPDNAGTITILREWQQSISFGGVAYDRKIIHCRAGQQACSWKLPVDAGYNMRINAYWIGGEGKSFVRFEDAIGEYLFDPKAEALYLIVAVRGVRYAGIMDKGETSVYASWPADESQTPSTVQVGKNLAVPLATMVSDPKGVYLGHICSTSHEWRFTPGKDAHEVPIKKLFAPLS